MRKLFSRRPSGSMVVAMLALVVATSGTAIAASSLVNGDSLIKKGTLSGNRLKGHTITGSQVNLSKLGKVPSAKQADSAKSATNATNATNAANAANAANATNATNATNAATVGGRSVTTFSVLSATSAATPTTALSVGGLTVLLQCDGTGNPSVTATGSVTGSLIRGAGNSTSSSAFRFGTSSIAAGTPVTLWSPGDRIGSLVFQYATPAGHVVSVNAEVDDHNTINNFNGCSISGSAISG